MPLLQYKENLKALLVHIEIVTQDCNILLITPPPIDEHQHEIKDRAAGQPELTRFAASARAYAEACRQVGEEVGVPVLDLWSCLMKQAGWSGSNVLAGSRDAPKNDVLNRLLSDGRLLPFVSVLSLACADEY